MKTIKMIPKSKAKKPTKRKMEKQLQQLFKAKGTKINILAKKAMFKNEENIKSKEVRDALHYFLDEYWTDLIRPTLISLVCEAVGGNTQTATTIAVPIMLIAGGIDIHDDIIDKSNIKNERPTILGKYGQDIALLTGDALIFKGFSLLHIALKNVPKEKAKQVLTIFEKTFFELGDAEALEFEFKGKRDVHPEDYLKVMDRKAADVEAYTHISALICNGTKQETEALRKYGRILGTLSIIRDDLIDMTDEEELLHRLENETTPLPILYASLNNKTKQSFENILSQNQLTKKDAKKIAEITKTKEGYTKTRKTMDILAEQAFRSLKPLKHKKAELTLLINMIKNI